MFVHCLMFNTHYNTICSADPGLEAVFHLNSIAGKWWPAKAAARPDEHLL